ncbi:MAG: hypothetical protein H6737_12810 [Alphaproteobacteria bacterium]|nr:hypothetical protein [Alphaproteobacteria bacterium]
MRKSWLVLAVVAFFGVVLAFVVFALTMSGTGGDVPESERVAIDLTGPDRTRPAPVRTDKPFMARPGADPADPDDDGNGMHEPTDNPINPIAAPGIERRAQPDAVAAGRATAPWSLVRRTLLDQKDELALEALDQSAQIIADLRQARRDPDSVDFAALEQRQVDLANRIRESQHGSNPTIQGALERLDSVLAEYHESIGE